MEPVSLADAKLMLRLDPGEGPEDAVVAGFIAAAREMIERYTGLILTRREVVEAMPSFGRWIELRSWPVVSVDGVSYLDRAGAAQDLDATAWRTSLAGRPVRLLPATAGWPAACAIDAILPVTVTLTAGYAPEDMPATIRQAILLLVGHWYEHRGGEDAGKVDEMPPTVAGLLRSWRLWRV